MNLQIRLAESYDIERLIALQSNSIRSLSTDDYEPREIESLILNQARARLRGNEIFFLAFEKDKLVGFACLVVNSSLLAGLYVHPQFIRQGIGTHLLEFLNKTAIDQGCRVIEVYSSLTAVNFYKARGFQVIRDCGFFTEDSIWIPCVYMKKKLVDNSNLDKISNSITIFISQLKSKTFSDSHLILIFLISSLLPLIIILLKKL